MTELIAELDTNHNELHPIGQNKAKWNGGLAKCNGYVYVYSPLHPFKNKMGKGYVKRARLVMEDFLGRYLKKTEIVHHKNGKRDDDTLDNLELMDFTAHQKYHQSILVNNMLRDSFGRFTKKKVRG